MVWEIIAKLKIKENDPTFLIMLSLGYIQTCLEEVPQQLAEREAHLANLCGLLHQECQQFSQQAKALSLSMEWLETKVRQQTPTALGGRGFFLREVVAAVLCAFVAGLVFGRPLLALGLSTLCERQPALCLVTGEKNDG